MPRIILLMIVALFLMMPTGFCKYKHYFSLDELHYLRNQYEKQAFQLEAELASSDLSYVVSSGYTPRQLTIRSQLAYLYAVLGHYDDAVALCQDVLTSMAKSGQLNEDGLQVKETVANVYQSIGRYEDALKLYEQLNSDLATLASDQSQRISRLSNRIVVAHMLADDKVDVLNTAEQNYARCLKLWGAQHENTVDAQLNLAMLYQSRERISDALTYAQNASQFYQGKPGKQDLIALRSMERLASLYKANGRQAEAIPLLEKTVQGYQNELGDEYSQTLGAIRDLGQLYWQEGRNDEAVLLLKNVVGKIEKLRTSEVAAAENRQAFFAQWTDVYKVLADINIQKGKKDDAFYLSELTKARTLLESAALKYEETKAGLSEQDYRQITTFQDEINRLDGEIVKTFDSPTRKLELEKQKASYLDKLTDFRYWLKTENSKYARLNSAPLIVDAEQGRQLLKPDTVFVSYAIHANKIMIFTLSRDNGLQAISVAKPDGFEQSLDAYRKVLVGKKVWQMPNGSFMAKTYKPDAKAVSIDHYSKIAQYLSSILLDPIDSQLTSKRNWIICPDGVLAMIPFETLISKDQVAVATHDISYVQSLSLMKILLKRSEEYKQLVNRKSLFAMGAAFYREQGDNQAISRSAMVTPEEEEQQENALFNLMRSSNDITDTSQVKRAFDAANLTWENLPASEQEVDNLATTFIAPSIYKKQNATEDKLTKLNAQGELAQYRYLVFSTHGYLNPQMPALSAIVLGQLNNPQGIDGYATVIELMDYNLKSDLVVLSACETGLGKAVQGEGIMGLPYAFYLAGNTNTVMTLWKVVDESTTKFNSQFMTKLKNGQTFVQALNQTKRDFLADNKYNEPLYWAPFVYYGIQ